MPYPEMLVAPMRAELSQNGFQELKDAESVTTVLDKGEGTQLGQR